LEMPGPDPEADFRIVRGRIYQPLTIFMRPLARVDERPSTPAAARKLCLVSFDLLPCP
jgi:hypothetical protein